MSYTQYILQHSLKTDCVDNRYKTENQSKMFF